MPFFVGESNLDGTINSGTIVTLSPGPTYVDYPEKFSNEIRFSKDGNPIIQSPLKDSRPRQWIWTRYRDSVKGYITLYNQLLNYQYKLRTKFFPCQKSLGLC